MNGHTRRAARLALAALALCLLVAEARAAGDVKTVARQTDGFVLTPFLRSHSESGSKPHEPYAYGEEFTKINRASIELRYRLLPYLYSLFNEHTQTGAPVMRPLWFEYPDDWRTYTIEDEYLVGRDLLVAPVVRESETKRRVYFPAGDDWVDWWTGKTYEGGKDAEIDAPLERLPLFARVGASIPTQPVVQHTGEMKDAPLTLVITPGRPFKSETWEDGGDGYNIVPGDWAYNTVVAEESGKLLLFQVSAESVRSPKFVELLGLTRPPREVTALVRGIDKRGVKVTLVAPLPVGGVSFDAEKGRLRIPLPAESRNSITELTFTY